MIRRTVPIEMARTVLKKCNITAPPVDIEGIVKTYRIELYHKNLPDDISGILNVENEKEVKIFVNKFHAHPRQRFTISHELGHFFLHKNIGIHIDKKSFFRDKSSQSVLYPMEIEANRFAAEILMPKEYIENELENYEDIIDIDEDIVLNLAKKFKVSTTAMSIRFQSLDYSF